MADTMYEQSTEVSTAVMHGHDAVQPAPCYEACSARWFGKMDKTLAVVTAQANQLPQLIGWCGLWFHLKFCMAGAITCDYLVDGQGRGQGAVIVP